MRPFKYQGLRGHGPQPARGTAIKWYWFLTVPLAWGLLLLFWPPGQGERRPALKIQVTPITLKDQDKPALLKRVWLTDAQRHRVRLSRARFRSQTARIESEISVQEAGLENELDAENPGLGRVNALCKKIGLLYAQKLGARISFRLEVERKILTPAQLAQLEDLRDGDKSQAGNLALSK